MEVTLPSDRQAFIKLAMADMPDFSTQQELDAYIANLESDMREAAKKFEFEKAVKLRDTVKELRTKEFLFS
jgi:excinuclease ABC subunit B